MPSLAGEGISLFGSGGFLRLPCLDFLKINSAPVSRLDFPLRQLPVFGKHYPIGRLHRPRTWLFPTVFPTVTVLRTGEQFFLLLAEFPPLCMFTLLSLG